MTHASTPIAIRNLPICRSDVAAIDPDLMMGFDGARPFETPEAARTAAYQAALSGGPVELGEDGGDDGFILIRGVAIVPVHGVLMANESRISDWLGWATYQGLIRIFDTLAARDDVTAVVCHFHSPGGDAYGVEEVARAMGGLSVPIIGWVDAMAASAAYWLASQSSSITVDLSSRVGSVGVMQLNHWPVAEDYFGEREVIITSPFAKAKRPNPTTDEGRALIMPELAELETRMHASVAAGRGVEVEDFRRRTALTEDPTTGGAVFAGEAAVERGLADLVEPRGDVLSRILAEYGADPDSSARPRPRAQSAQALAAAAAARAAI
ncbi:MAG: S49 family peptidase [Pseudomonadota bacterium]